MLTQILESILSKLGESFLSKVVEQTTNNAHNNVKSIKEFELILKSLQRKLKSLSAKASDVEEEIKNAELSGRKKRKREVEEWLEEVRSIEKQVVELGSQVESEGFIIRLMEGGSPEKLNDQVDKLVEQSRNFGELVLDVCGTSYRGETLLTNGMVGEAFNENLETILKLLETRQVSSIGVYGMGGVGKTTLAKHIHNRLQQQSQGCVIWVTVSQEFTITSLQDKIARILGVDLVGEDNEDIRAARLHRTLSQMKNSVLILDDVWENIDMVKVGCLFSVECCRLIITTRSLEVCRQICCQKVVPVENLHPHEAWKLFNELLRNEIELDPTTQEIARCVAELCGGLPLGIVTVAGIMRGERAIHAWKNAFVELKERVVGKDGMGEGDDVYKVLKYSFDRLSRNHHSQSNEFNTLQHCFLYCALYPEDELIDRENLVREFISGGLLDERKTRRAQVHQGHSILDKLVNVCLLERSVFRGEFGPNECVKMHDLVRGMALKIGEGKYMVRAGDESMMEIPDEQEWNEGLEKVSLMKSGIRRIGDGISPDCPKLSTLLLCCYWLEVIPNSFFSKMPGLCTLDLCCTNITMLPSSICNMKSLKALLLGSCHKLKNVPYLGKLKALRELNLSYTAIEEVPQGLEELFNLKFLAMDAPKLKMLPTGLFLKLRYLQHLDVPFHILVLIEEIEDLKLLEEFSGRVKNLKDYNSFIKSWESRVHDTCYTIGVGSYDATFYAERGLCYNKELFLSECNLKDERVLGEDIVHLAISKCEGLNICFLDNFTGLKILKIQRCGGIECILRSEQGLSPQISTLEDIEVVELEAMKGVIEKGEIGAAAAPMFSSLRRLKIVNCNKMRSLGLPALGVPNLEEITVMECEKVEVIFEDEGRGSISLPKLKYLWLHELPRLRNVGLPVSGVPKLEVIHMKKCGEIEEIFILEDEGRGSVSLPRLKQLELEELPRLKHVCKAKMICNSISMIYITKCPRLMRKLPVSLDVPPRLKIIINREWWESMEWNNPNLPLFLQRFFDLKPS